MNQIEFFDENVYSKSVKMKSYLKFGITCACSILGIAAFVTGITFGIVHFNSSMGKGGAVTPEAVELAEEIEAELESDNELEANVNDALTYTSYRIRQGDQIGRIAEKFGITQDTLLSVNNIRNSRTIQVGQYLKVPSIPGIMYTVQDNSETPQSIAEKYNVEAEKCAFINNVDATEALAQGKSVFVPDAKLDWETLQEINGDLFLRPIRGRYRISSRFGWRTNPFNSAKRTYHGGMDMACPKGTPVYSASPGIVTTAGWSDVYGYYVIVTHTSGGYKGYRTLYGHLSKIRVRKNQKVNTDSWIGDVGSTGMSTGPHLHFTVYKNGRSVNPANFLK